MSPTFFVVIPAAGIGQRMGEGVPKQYLSLEQHSLLDLAIQPFLDHPGCQGVMVAIHAQDQYWHKSLHAKDPKVSSCCGGASRAESVLAGLEALSNLQANDWVLVHDGARPCLRNEDLDYLLSNLANDPVGGLLGVPVRDTLKRVNNNQKVVETVDRSGLWQAFSPQMFRYGLLCEALQKALADGVSLTDDASALEYMGHPVRMVQGHSDNLKVTYPGDLQIAARLRQAL